jgi:ectoine hydroxylase-related dioxygenase (phytanoyl-CoA dioxygenase family)
MTTKLTPQQIDTYNALGHLTVPAVFSLPEMDDAIADAQAWGREFLSTLDPAKRAWYLERSTAEADVLRKLDNPVHHRPAFQKLAKNPALVGMVESLVGPGVSVYFSQIFFKPPRGGGPKPVHQDNFYFGPNNLQGVVTAWIALDEATIENGCMWFGEGTNKGPVYKHVAPPDEPFNLQVPADIAKTIPMTPGPVPRGGVSFHHGNTFHQSSDNNSDKWRRAAALHYVNHNTRFVTPALPYDHSIVFKVS